MATKRELREAEDTGWGRFIGLLESLTPRQIEASGYLVEGWSVKDLMAHVGAWQAEAVQVFEQIWTGTFRPGPLDVDEMNQRFLESNRDLPLSIVWAELWSARTRMLTEFGRLPEVTHDAEEWFRESGALHYDGHLPRLEEWVAELKEGA